MYALLPKGAKPSKALSKDTERPTLCVAFLQETAAGGWEIVGTDSYKLVRIPLNIHDANDAIHGRLASGPIGADAMNAIERAGGLALTADGRSFPVDRYGVEAGATYARPTLGHPYPDVNVLEPKQDGSEFTIGLDAKSLYELAQSMGGTGRNAHKVALTFASGDDGRPSALRPIAVRPVGSGGLGTAILMHVRV